MSRTATAIIERELLSWARDSARLSIDAAAQKIGQPAERLRAWEAGESAPTVAQLRKIASVYKRPLAVFYLSEPPKEFDALRDHRRLPGTEQGMGPTLAAEVRRVQLQREIAAELSVGLGGDLPTPEIPHVVPSDPESLGRLIRQILGVSIEDQSATRNEHKALALWIRATEAVGVLVAQVSGIRIQEMRGCLVMADVYPVIVLNGSDSPRGRVFTLLHEWSHLLLRNGGICDLDDGGSLCPDDNVETLCNASAAAALLPRQVLADDPVVSRTEGDDYWTEDLLGSLSAKYGVSKEATLRRLATIGIVSMDLYLARRHIYLSYLEESSPAKSGRGNPYHVLQLRNVGEAYTRIVLEAYYQMDITSADLADLLGMRLKHLPAL